MDFDREYFSILILSFLLLFLGSFVFFKNPRGRAQQSFFLLSFSAFFWVISRYLEDKVFSYSLKSFFLLLDFSSGIFFIVSSLLFCLDIVFPKIFPTIFRFSLILFPIGVSLFIFFSSLVLSGYQVSDNGTIYPQYGNFGWTYDALLVTFSLISILVLLWGLKRSRGGEIMLYLYPLIGILFTVIIALVTNVFVPVEILYGENYKFYSLAGILSPFFLVLFSSYSIFRYHLFNIRILFAEAVLFFILFITFIQIFIISDPLQILLRSMVFITLLFLSVMLIRSVNNEVRRKEELQRLTDDLAEANAELRRLDESKTEFISIASHQLRTPLSAIKGFVALLADGSYGTLPKTAEDIVKRVSIATERLIRLVENLLNISRMEAGRLEYRYTEVDFSDVLFELRDSFSVLASEKEVAISFDIPERGVMPCFLLDRDKMIEVISNLIDNALKYTPHGFVRVRAELLYDAVRISVTDTGMGFSPEMKPLLFQKFSRGRHAERFDTNGSGLGLYVGKRMVEAQGGKIWATSEGEGKGSSFFVSFPIKRAE